LRFRIEPEDFLRAEQAAAQAGWDVTGWDVIGIYHSHPDHPARPSEYDRDHTLPFYSYLIAGVDAGKIAALTS
jgi:proteasome lid subunit RPN8/RPN11